MTTANTKHLIDPELIPLLDMLPPLNPTRESLPQIRAMFDEMTDQMLATLPEAPDISVSEHHIPGPQGAPDVRVLVSLPKNASTPTPALLWMHGGGYLWDNADRAYPLVKGMIAATGCAAVSVDYRLAPETPHPGPVEDCYAALKWLYTHAEELGVDASRIAIGGESAGAGLAAALAHLTRDHGEVPLLFQLLMYPMLDDRTATATDLPPTPVSTSGQLTTTALLGQHSWDRSLVGQTSPPMLQPLVPSGLRDFRQRLLGSELLISSWKRIWNMPAG